MFFYIVKAAILAGLIQILILTRKPKICAAIYAVMYSLLTILSGGDFLFGLIFGTPIVFGLTYGYYWLLDRLYEGSIGLFWAAIFLGLFIGIL